VTEADDVSALDVRTNDELVAATRAGLRWLTYTRVVLELTMLVAMVVLARLIPPSAFGVFAVVLIVQELAMSVPAEGIGSALVQRRSIQPAHLQAGLAVSLLMGTTMASVTVVLALVAIDPLFGHETAQLILVASPCFIIGAIVAVPMAVLRRRLDFARLSQLDLAGTLARLTATVSLAFAGLDALALVLGSLLAFLVILAGACAIVRPPMPRWHRQEIRDLLGYGRPASLAAFAWTGFRNGDYAIVNYQLGAAQAGFYWRAYQVGVEYQRKIGTVMMQMAFPVLARTTSRHEMLALRQRMVLLLTVVLFPLLALLVLLAPTLVPWLFGPQWEPAVLPTQILAVGGAASLVSDTLGSTLQAAGRAKALLGFGVAHFGVYVAAVVIVASQGLVAVACAGVVVHSLFLVAAYQLTLGGRGGLVLRTMWDDLAAAGVSCAGLVAVALPTAWAMKRWDAPTTLHLAAVTAAGGVAYLVVLHTLFPAAFADLIRVLRRVTPDPVLRTLGPLRLLTSPRRPSSQTG
jgi:O-antigen/teichoic acid export membrane protein